MVLTLSFIYFTLKLTLERRDPLFSVPCLISLKTLTSFTNLLRSAAAVGVQKPRLESIRTTVAELEHLRK